MKLARLALQVVSHFVAFAFVAVVAKAAHPEGASLDALHVLGWFGLVTVLGVLLADIVVAWVGIPEPEGS